MNFQFDAIMFLALFTLGAGLVIGIISFTRAKRAQDHREDAAVAERQRHEGAGEPVEGTPGDIDPTVSGHRTGGPAPTSTSRNANGAPVASTDSGRSWSEERGANPPTPEPPRN
jgi:hypothetical protein